MESPAKILVYNMYLPAIPAKPGQNIARATGHLLRLFNSNLLRPGDIIRIGPVLDSQGIDPGYDILSHEIVNSSFGNTDTLDFFITTAHKLGLKVIIDLPLNRTSIAHGWFRYRSGYYYWSDDPHSEWKNTFDGGPAWRWDAERHQYYLCSRHAFQADLAWFPNGIENGINVSLLKRMQKIIALWVEEHNVDGFRLGDPAILSKDVRDKTLDLNALSQRDGGIKLFNALFPTRDPLVLLMEHRYPAPKDASDDFARQIESHYISETPVQLIENAYPRSAYDEDRQNEDRQNFWGIFKEETQKPYSVLTLESQDTSRFLRQEGLTGPAFKDELCMLFGNPSVKQVGLFYGQEYGLGNPSVLDLPDEELLKLDPQTAANVANGKDINELRPYSKANVRYPILNKMLARAPKAYNRNLEMAVEYISAWRNS